MFTATVITTHHIGSLQREMYKELGFILLGIILLLNKDEGQYPNIQLETFEQFVSQHFKTLITELLNSAVFQNHF
jgi:hypothetical protein